MTNPDQEEKATLKYRMQGAGGEIGHWGHEYVRHISGMFILLLIMRGHIYIYLYFSQNQKGFGCIGAAVLLILSPKELI